MRVLIAGVGYTNLRDLSLGPLVIERLEGTAWPPGFEVDVLDASFGAVNVAIDLQEINQRRPYDRVVVIGAVGRGRAPGTVTCFRWDGVLPPPGLLQAHVAEAVTGVISLDGLLFVCRHFGALPDEVVVVEIEPADEDAGPGFSPIVERAIEPALAAVRRAVLTPAAELARGAIPTELSYGWFSTSDGPERSPEPGPAV
jgi:hydrogenase maturation protease